LRARKPAPYFFSAVLRYHVCVFVCVSGRVKRETRGNCYLSPYPSNLAFIPESQHRRDDILDTFW
jgi:hypothetical protein